MGVADPEKQDKDVSPDERLLWHNQQEELDAMISPIVPRRGKKRARSSSPLSSPAVEKLRTPAVNVKKLRQALKTTHADPALDLWDRFAVGGPDDKNPLGATNPALAHLMVSSSPRPPKDGMPSHTENGLRRAVSCGSHWPKRRRVEAISETRPVRDRGCTTKSSMVTALLETVNGEINKSDPDEMEEDSVVLESPSMKKRQSPRKPAALANCREWPQTLEPGVIEAKAQDVEDAETPTSDYGDDEFDDNTLWELDDSLLSGQTEAGSFTAADKTLLVGNGEEPPKQVAFSDDDDFGDMDDDLLAAADDIIAEATPKPTPRTVPASAVKTARLDGGIDDSDDIYGDDFGGDFDFEAAELAATQSVGQTTSSLMPVRTVR